MASLLPSPAALAGQGTARRGKAWLGVVRLGEAWAATAALGQLRFAPLLPSPAALARSGQAWRGQVWLGLTWHGAAWAADSSTEGLRPFSAALIQGAVEARHGEARRGRDSPWGAPIRSSGWSGAIPGPVIHNQHRRQQK